MIPQNNEIRFEVTTRCNYNCIICARDKLTRKIETMSFTLFKQLFDKIINETSQYNTVAFPGMGEPLLDPTLDKKIAYIRKKDFKILILTNGSLLSVKKFTQLEKLGVNSIRVSFYGNSPEVYAKVHGVKEGLFNKVKNNLTNIAKIKAKTKLLLTYNVIQGYNEQDLESWIKYWEGKADLLEAWRPHNWVNGKNYRKVQKKKMNTCGRPWKTPLQIQADGTVNMCCFDFDGKLLLGNLKTQSLKEIFESPIFKKILRCHISGNFKNSGLICENCAQRNSDKSDVLVYSSKFDPKERVKMVSTVYSKLI